VAAWCTFDDRGAFAGLLRGAWRAEDLVAFRDACWYSGGPRHRSRSLPTIVSSGCRARPWMAGTSCGRREYPPAGARRAHARKLEHAKLCGARACRPLASSRHTSLAQYDSEVVEGQLDGSPRVPAPSHLTDAADGGYCRRRRSPPRSAVLSMNSFRLLLADRVVPKGRTTDLLRCITPLQAMISVTR
jgi:hypothetical protein